MMLATRRPMRRAGLLGPLVTLAFALGIGSPAAADEAALQVGDPAPDFALQASDGKTYRLADFRGKQAVVLAWYPKAFTKGCTIECKSLAENGHLIRAYDAQYFMASVDDVDTNSRFAEAQKADFPLLADPDKTVARAYGVLLPEYDLAARQTFYIGKDGRILAIDREVKPETAAQDIAATLGELGIPRR
ncbi:MAG TPA: peroxiredoxin [Pseudomonadales bacterium]